MRTRSTVLVAAMAAFGLALQLGHPALAEDEFDAAVEGAEAKIIAKGEWHINKDFPWKVVSGDKKMDKEKFVFEEKTFHVRDLPKGDSKIVGGVCSASSCLRIEKIVTVR